MLLEALKAIGRGKADCGWRGQRGVGGLLGGFVSTADLATASSLGAPSAFTLGSVGKAGVECSTIVAGGAGGAAELKTVASWRRAVRCSSVRGLRGEAACGCSRAWIKS